MALQRELEAFRRELPRLLEDPANRGKYALVHGETVDSIWPDREQALAAGYQRFGLEPFLVQHVTDDEEPRYFSHRVTPCHY